MDKRILTNEDCLLAVERMREAMVKAHRPGVFDGEIIIHGVPRGGVPVAYLCAMDKRFALGDDPEQTDFIVDDVVGSGATRKRYLDQYHLPFFSLAEYLEPRRQPGTWLVFPWEKGDADSSADDIIIRLLEFIGEDPNREGLLETPKRVLKAWADWTCGYRMDPAAVLKCFGDGSENYDQMVLVKDLPFYSICEHHLAPFFGTATIAYIPDKRVVGLSKLGRVLGIYARRLQVQERITTQVADAIQTHLQPKGVGVLIKARHLCMESRGLSQQGHHTVTSALRGEFMSDEKVRNEFLKIAS